MNKYRVYFNTHEYNDTSDKPKSSSKIVKAENEENARELICQMRDKRETVGTKNKRYIGLIFDATLV